MPVPTLTPAVLSALRARFGDAMPEPEVLGAGEWSSAYELTVDGRSLVVRVGRYREDYLKDQIAAKLFASSRVPVPEIIAFGETDGLCYAVAERVHGIGLDELDAAEIDRVLPSLLGVLDEIHACDVAQTTGFGDWGPDRVGGHASWAQSLLAVGDDRARFPGWRDELATSPADSTKFDQGLEHLASVAPRLPAVRELIHRDLFNRNILVSGTAVAGVLDWGCSLYGDSLYDAAWLAYCWALYPQWSAIDIRSRIRQHLEAAGLLPADFEERLHAYEVHIGLGAVQFCAFVRRWDQVEWHADAVAKLIAA